MGTEPTSTPKLFLYSLPPKPPEPPGMLTPPLQIPGSIPFQWEEAPGIPRASSLDLSKPKSSTVRCLDLPNNVLDGPYVGRSMSRGESENVESGRVDKREKGGYFGSWRWGTGKENRKIRGGSFDFWDSDRDGGKGQEENCKVKITRVRRKGSLSSLSSYSSAHLWKSFMKTLSKSSRGESKQANKI
ncbi:Protein of unknown function DUF688 [Dillenia turbinata]|uniref:Uncharacterized protein n=1 Tax=Dillenia turbinata TaxID=194707 RepID=A0AAN8VEH6_9MAGN